MSAAMDAYKLSLYIRSLSDFEWCYQSPHSGHAGEILSNAILQAGVRFQTVVAPRLRRILAEFPDAHTVPLFQVALRRHGPDHVLQWSHPEKPARLKRLTDVLIDSSVVTVVDMREWLQSEQNRYALLNISGIGPKTIDYLANLVGISTVAVDRHIRSFVGKAGVVQDDYYYVKSIVEFAADMLGVSRSDLDASIWRYQAEPQRTLPFF